MKTLLIFLLLAAVYSLAYAHGTYQSKSFEFHREGHIVDVRIESDNELHVFMDTVEIGTRTNFCTPID